MKYCKSTTNEAFFSRIIVKANVMEMNVMLEYGNVCVRKTLLPDSSVIVITGSGDMWNVTFIGEGGLK